ncbi:MAG TPA: KGG domain-containing protein [Planctomycetota bacterium]|nr:KGG domain-containing protein [Planctomycetota bacterium]
MPRTKGRSVRGFAAMDEEKQREIASKGGRAAHAEGTAHEFTPEEAARAGRKGGIAVSRDRKHMAEIGRQGGKARGEARKGSRSVTRARRVGGRGQQRGAQAGRQGQRAGRR